MLVNLKHEIFRYGYKYNEIEEMTGINKQRLGRAILSVGTLGINDAIAIKNKCFPDEDYSYEYLFFDDGVVRFMHTYFTKEEWEKFRSEYDRRIGKKST